MTEAPKDEVDERIAYAFVNEPADSSGYEQARRSKDPLAAAQLYSLMSDISEEHWCAGWMSGNEESLWAAMNDGSRDYGMGEIADVDIAALKRLHEQCGGWWYWHDDQNEPGLHHSHWGPRFLTTDEWIARCAETSER
jgi:hypothetical protein